MPNDHPLLRPYQFEANAAVEQAVADRKRQMLLAMATGQSSVRRPNAEPGGSENYYTAQSLRRNARYRSARSRDFRR
jgi:hypothetical protein